MTLIQYVAIVEISLTQEEVEKFTSLAKQLNTSFPEAVKMCMSEKCEEYLKLFKENIPDAVEPGAT